MALTHLSVLYRGPLSSCNYGCPYCPFAKRRDSPAQHRADAEALTRFTAWVAAQPFDVSVLFTPWGEALIHPRYQRAMAELSALPNVRQVAAQTNLSGRLAWLGGVDRAKVGLWATFHPQETTLTRFLDRCAQLERLGVRYSVGVVGRKSHFPAIAALRAALPAGTYLWVNAYSQGPRKRSAYYQDADLAFLRHVDPLFDVNTRHYPTRGRACRAGEDVISVGGDGVVTRCHFIARPLGNLYEQDVRDLLRPRPCSRASCECHIGYVHLPDLAAAEVFGAGLLARIPEGRAWPDPAAFLERAAALLTPP